MGDNKSFWSRYAWIYEKFTRGSKSAEKAYYQMETRICSHLNSKMKVIELAAGPGIMSRRIASVCGSLEVTDFAPEMIEQAKKKNISDNVKFAVADATQLLYGNQMFDAVIIANALHIMPDPQKALMEIKRVLRKDGILIAPTFTRENVKSKFMEKFMEVFGFKTFSKWTHETFKDFMKQEGFNIFYEEVIAGHNFPISFLVCKKCSKH